MKFLYLEVKDKKSNNEHLKEIKINLENIIQTSKNLKELIEKGGKFR